MTTKLKFQPLLLQSSLSPSEIYTFYKLLTFTYKVKAFFCCHRFTVKIMAITIW